MNVTFLKLLQLSESFASAHLEVKRFKGDFLEQLGNFATTSEAYPILYAVPGNASFDSSIYTSLSAYTITFYAVDIIQKDRANVTNVLNTCSQILNDLHKWFKEGEITGVDVLQVSTITPLNN